MSKKPQLRAIKFLNEDQNVKSNKKNEEKSDDKSKEVIEEKKSNDEHSDKSNEEHELQIKQKYIYKNLITIIVSALCLSISLGVNEVFLLYLRKKDTQDIVLTIKYVFCLIIFTLGVSYYFNLGIE
jgi:cation transport ATPase